MPNHGFRPPEERRHLTLRDEPRPDTCFPFPVSSDRAKQGQSGGGGSVGSKDPAAPAALPYPTVIISILLTQVIYYATV